MLGVSDGAADGIIDGIAVGGRVGDSVVCIAVSTAGVTVTSWHAAAYIPGARAAFIKLHFTVTPHDLVLASYSHPMLLVARLSHIRWHAAAEAADHGRPFQAETHE